MKENLSITIRINQDNDYVEKCNSTTAIEFDDIYGRVEFCMSSCIDTIMASNSYLGDDLIYAAIRESVKVLIGEPDIQQDNIAKSLQFDKEHIYYNER